jgi:acyl phosphate:glycerol-3-phosphate acyltransferase
MLLLPFIFPGYLFGSIPWGVILTRAAGLGDIRAIGSGSIGATNVLRTGRKGIALATLLLDAAKGAVAVGIFKILGPPGAELWAGVGAILGHLFPVWLGFKGGKGVATGLGVLLVAAWPVALIAGAAWIAVFAVSRISSLGSLTACAVAPIAAAFLGAPGIGWMTLACAAMIAARHHQNISRLLAGTEPRFGRKAG